jgi:hypothetical protein
VPLHDWAIGHLARYAPRLKSGAQSIPLIRP